MCVTPPVPPVSPSTSYSTGTPSSGSTILFSQSESPCTSIVPWHKMPDAIIKLLEEEEILDKRDRNIMINVVWNELYDKNQVSRKRFREISNKIVSKYPHSFEKFVDGIKISDGKEELLLYLENKRDNANRSETKKVKNVKHEVILNNQKEDMNKLQILYKKKNTLTVDGIEEITLLMAKNYVKLCSDIEKDIPIIELKELWPFFFCVQHFINHFETLTTYNLKSAFDNDEGLFIKQLDRLVSFMQDKGEFLNVDSKASKLLWAYEIIAKSFQEDETELITSQNTLNIEKLKPCTPLIVAIGPNTKAAMKYIILVDRQEISECANIKDAMAMQFAAFWNFKICYPRKVTNTLEFIQMFMLKMKDPTNSRKRRKSCDKVVKLSTEILNYENDV